MAHEEPIAILKMLNTDLASLFLEKHIESQSHDNSSLIAKIKSCHFSI